MKKTKLSSLHVLTVIIMLVIALHSCAKENEIKCEYCSATKDGQTDYEKVCGVEQKNAFLDAHPGALISCE